LEEALRALGPLSMLQLEATKLFFLNKTILPKALPAAAQNSFMEGFGISNKAISDLSQKRYMSGGFFVRMPLI
jgi:hypothetical protein